MRFGLSLARWLRRGRAAPLRILFVDPSVAYTVETPYAEPLGGSQSSVCYLAEALAALGQRVVLLTATSARRGVYRGVECIGLASVSDDDITNLSPDVVVAVLAARNGRTYRGTFGERATLVLWTGHAHDQPAVAGIADPEERECYDGIALVSEWQRELYVSELGVERSRAHVLGNAVGPAFLDLYPAGTEIGASRARPPVLAYTSAPYRGLNRLIEVFPEIRRRVPGTRLKVFSAMRMYGREAAGDEAYEALYRRCRETEGVEYVGSLPQPQLARELTRVTALAYPSTFAETYCISAVEAMAAGCRVVTSDLGALRETTAGYARLVPNVEREQVYAAAFADAVVETLEESLAGSDEALLREQVDYVNRECTWAVRARQWMDWLSAMR